MRARIPGAATTFADVRAMRAVIEAMVSAFPAFQSRQDAATRLALFISNRQNSSKRVQRSASCRGLEPFQIVGEPSLHRNFNGFRERVGMQTFERVGAIFVREGVTID